MLPKDHCDSSIHGILKDTLQSLIEASFVDEDEEPMEQDYEDGEVFTDTVILFFKKLCLKTFKFEAYWQNFLLKRILYGSFGVPEGSCGFLVMKLKWGLLAALD